MPHSKKCDELVSQTPASAENYAQPVNCGETPTEVAPVPPSPNIYPMNWYNFLVYFGLFVSAVMYVFNGLDFLTGSYLGEVGEALYETIPEFQSLDVVAGIFYIAMGVCAIVVRQKLVKYEKDAPKTYISYLIASAVGSAAHFFFFWVLATTLDSRRIDMLLSGLSSMFIFVIALAVGEIMANRVYFEKRKDLFKY